MPSNIDWTATALLVGAIAVALFLAWAAWKVAKFLFKLALVVGALLVAGGVVWWWTQQPH